jgi:hypothetical protein
MYIRQQKYHEALNVQHYQRFTNSFPELTIVWAQVAAKRFTKFKLVAL